MVPRRAFLIGMLATLAAPPRGTAGGNVSISARRIGVLGPRTPADGAPFIDAFVEGLRALGWENGKNVAIELRWAHGRTDRLAAIATELVHLKVDVILAASTTAAVAASKATTTLPIVVPVVGDPETIGLAANLSRPAGNVTGLTYAVGTGIVGKQLELLKEAIPRVSRVAVVSNPDNPSHAGSVKEVAAAASALGARLQVLQAHRPSDFDRVFAAIARERADALLVLPDSLFGFHRAQLHAMATRARLPAVYGLREHA